MKENTSFGSCFRCFSSSAQPCITRLTGPYTSVFSSFQKSHTEGFVVVAMRFASQLFNAFLSLPLVFSASMLESCIVWLFKNRVNQRKNHFLYVNKYAFFFVISLPPPSLSPFLFPFPPPSLPFSLLLPPLLRVTKDSRKTK